MLLEKLAVFILLIISYVLQVSADFFVLGSINPDFLLILTAYFAFYRGEFSGIWIGFFAGLLQDINLGGYLSLSSSSPEMEYYIGTHTLPKSLMGYMVGKLSPHLKSESNILIFLLLFVLGTVKGIMVFLLVVLFHHGISPSALLSIVLPEAAYTGIIGLFWFKLLKMIFPIQQGASKEIFLGKMR